MSRKFQGLSFRRVSSKCFDECFDGEGVSRVFKKFQGCFKNVSMVFQGCLKGSFEEAQRFFQRGFN